MEHSKLLIIPENLYRSLRQRC